jgi:O-antigen/teichoic acid export membrane protein
MQRARDVFYLYVLENGLTIALCVALGRHSLAGLTASVSIAYTLAAAVAVFTLARHHVNIISTIWSIHVRRSLRASFVAAVVMALVYAAPPWDHGIRLIARLLLSLFLGFGAYATVVLVSHSSFSRRGAKDARL